MISSGSTKLNSTYAFNCVRVTKEESKNGFQKGLYKVIPQCNSIEVSSRLKRECTEDIQIILISPGIAKRSNMIEMDWKILIIEKLTEVNKDRIAKLFPIYPEKEQLWYGDITATADRILVRYEDDMLKLIVVPNGKYDYSVLDDFVDGKLG